VSADDEAHGLPVAAHVIRDVDALAAAFAAAEPFGHVVIDDFLDTVFAYALTACFPAFEHGSARGEDGRPGDKSTVERVRALGPAYARLDDTVRGRPFLDLMERITGIEGLLYDPWYLGGGTHSNRHGAKLDRHVDFRYHPLEGWQRRLNLIVYLDEGWQPGWGGNLQLFRDPHEDEHPFRSVAPAFNRCVIFETHDHSWHGFDRIVLPGAERHRVRRSIALYFYTPADVVEGPAPHSTVYVGDRLPSHLREGHRLSAADVAHLDTLLTDRDGRIRMQYDEIARLMALVRAYERGPLGTAMYLLRKLGARLGR
jgi:hypothetical protein